MRNTGRVPEGSLVALPPAPHESQQESQQERYGFVRANQDYFDTTTKTWEPLPAGASRQRCMSRVHACWQALARGDQERILACVKGLEARIAAWNRRCNRRSLRRLFS